MSTLLCELCGPLDCLACSVSHRGLWERDQEGSAPWGCSWACWCLCLWSLLTMGSSSDLLLYMGMAGRVVSSPASLDSPALLGKAALFNVQIWWADLNSFPADLNTFPASQDTGASTVFSHYNNNNKHQAYTHYLLYLQYPKSSLRNFFLLCLFLAWNFFTCNMLNLQHVDPSPPCWAALLLQTIKHQSTPCMTIHSHYKSFCAIQDNPWLFKTILDHLQPSRILQHHSTQFSTFKISCHHSRPSNTIPGH